jgi:predicted amidohydrolase
MVQNCPRKGALSENLAALDALLEVAPIGSFVLLPELFATSYILTPDELGVQDYPVIVQWMKEKARLGQYFIGGSVAFPTGTKMYNRWLGISKDGAEYYYDKVHLFVPGGEGKGYLGGGEMLQFSLNGLVVKPLICYDLRFPYISFQHKDCLNDVLVYVANWPAPRIEQWKQLLRARAIENQCYVVGVNRVGKDHYGNEYPGCSMVVDFMGKVLTEMDAEEGIESIVLHPTDMNNYRESYPFLKDIQPEPFQLRTKMCRYE